ncbi:MAG: flagellar hook-basal body complex protein FliE [Gemmatimonadales bacterium]
MTAPIGATTGLSQGFPLHGGGDTGARQVPVFGKQTDGGSFGDTLTKAINAVSSDQDNALGTMNAFMRGDNVELHQVMASSEEASLSLEMLIAVRDKFTDAYKSLISMQG